MIAKWIQICWQLSSFTSGFLCWKRHKMRSWLRLALDPVSEASLLQTSWSRIPGAGVTSRCGMNIEMGQQTEGERGRAKTCTQRKN